MLKNLGRHGDLLIKRVADLPKGLKRHPDGILREGEATGHNQPLVLLKYVCPSTDRIYVKPVPSKFTNADEAQADSFSLSVQDYYKIEVET